VPLQIPQSTEFRDDTAQQNGQLDTSEQHDGRSAKSRHGYFLCLQAVEEQT
jgi:hypothetical protein